MKKLILLLFAFLFSLGFSQMTDEEDALAEALMKRDLTKKEKAVLKQYMDKKYTTVKIFMADTEKIVKAGLYIPTEYEAECAGRLIARANKDGYNLKKWNYEELWDAAGNYCREYVDPYLHTKAKEPVIKIDMTTLEKPQVLRPSYKEANQYIQVNFSKNKKGINFNDFKIIDGDNVSFDIKNTIQEQINRDFSSDENGNYTAFYDVFYINNEPKKIKLKSRLNR